MARDDVIGQLERHEAASLAGCSRAETREQVSSATPRIALVSRELHPFDGGGIGEYIVASGRLHSKWCEVTVFTTSAHEAKYLQLRASGDPRLLPDDVEVVFVPEALPDEIGGFFSTAHLYSSRVLDALREHYGDTGPELVEFSDYLGEGAVTVQARRAGEPMLRKSVVGIRLHTTSELCAILDGHMDDSFESRALYELERLAVRDADYLVWSGGDTLALYQRFYGQREVAPGWRIRYPMYQAPAGQSEPMAERQSWEVRVLYFGRLERRKGVQNLIRAMSFVDSEHLRLSLLGGDTATAPLGGSMREHLHLMAANDGRIRFFDAVPRAEVPQMIRAHDAVILPSLWENWPYAALETLQQNTPIVATPVGGFTEMVRPELSGWLTRDTSPGSLADVLSELAYDPSEMRELRREKGPHRVFRELTDPDEACEHYRSMFERGGRWTAHGAPASMRRIARGAGEQQESPTAPRSREPSSMTQPLVSVVIPYYKMARYVTDTVESVIDQTYRRLEIIIVNDGSALDEDWVLAEIATRVPVKVITQLNAGLGAARNFGISQARGRFVLPLDPDDMLHPSFVQRAVEALANDPRAVYVTPWTRYVDEDGAPLAVPDVGYQPLGNASREVLRHNVAGTAIALLRRWLFDAGFAYSQELTSYEDWQLYQELHAAGHFGIVMPERMASYRVRADSMMRQVGSPRLARLSGELLSHQRETRTQWVYKRD
jgi:glycogen synthase